MMVLRPLSSRPLEPGRLGWEAAGWSRPPLAALIESLGRLLEPSGWVVKSSGRVRLPQSPSHLVRSSGRLPGPRSRIPLLGVRQHEDGTGFRRRLDRWLEEALEGDAGWYSLSGGSYSCQGISLLIVGPWHVKELAPLEISAELLDKEAVSCHVHVLGIPVAG